MNRRDFLIAGLAATAAVANGGASTAKATGATPPLEGSIRFDDAARAAAADDFGHVVHRSPEAVLLPGSDDDVAAAIRWAGRRRTRFAPQGERHSTYGRAQVEDGIVGDISRLRAIGPVESDRIVAGAGARWSEVLAATLPHGKTPPVLTDYLELSVGGTIAVGGVGGTSSRFGLQSDNVLEMDVVTGTGEVVRCSPGKSRDLFDAVRAGLGQVGVITAATLRLVAAPRSVRRLSLFYPDLASLLADARLLAGDDRFDAVQGAILPRPTGGFAFRIDAARYVTGHAPDDDALVAGLSDEPARREASTIGYIDYLNRLAALEAALRANGQWFFPHPWLTTFVGDSVVESVVGEELGRLDPPADLGPFGQIVLSPIRTAAIRTPLVRLPPGRLSFAFNLIRIPTTADADDAARLVRANTAAYGRIRDAGGTLYPVSAFPLSPGQWREHFGPAYARLERAKQRFDPEGVLTPGYGVFTESCGRSSARRGA